VNVKILPWQYTLALWLLVSPHLILSAFAADGIATDGTVGPPARILSTPNTTADAVIQQSDGTTVGQNLFHSFSKFNVESGQTVTFTENSPNTLDNVISRITGGSSSEINGLLRSTPGGHADFYLINPAGVLFGQNARIDVPAAFHASTADELKFKDGGKYSASQPSASALSAATPAAFGFLGTSSATNGLIDVVGSRLSVKNFQAADLVGSNIRFKNGVQLTAPSGEIRIVAYKGKGEVGLERAADGALPLPTAPPDRADAGAIEITNSTLITPGNGAGRVALWGGDTSVSNAGALVTINTGSIDAPARHGVDIQASSLQIVNGGQIANVANAAGAAGKLTVRADNILIDGRQANLQGRDTGILSFANPGSRGKVGNINIEASRDLEIFNGGEIINGTAGLGSGGDLAIKASSLKIAGPTFTPFGTTGILSATYGTGGAGNIKVMTDTLKIDGGATSSRGETGILSYATQLNATQLSRGRGGDVDIENSGDMQILDGGGVVSGTLGLGHGGNLTVKSASLTIAGSAFNPSAITGIRSATYGTSSDPSRDNDAGAINVDSGTLRILNGGNIFNTTFGSGNSGDALINAKNFTIDAQAKTETGVFSIAKPNSTGNTGAIDINSSSALAVLDGGLIKNATFGSGNAGDIRVTAGNLVIDGQDANAVGKSTGIFAIAQEGSSGRSGYIHISSAGAINITEGGEINLGNLGPRDSGKATIKATSLTIDGKGRFNNETPTGILANAFSTGNAGAIVVETDVLNIFDTGRISTSTFSSGDAGTIDVTTGNMTIDGKGQGIFTGIASRASPYSSGDAGMVKVSSGNTLSLIAKGDISTSTFGAGSGGSLQVSAAKLLLNNAYIAAEAAAGSSGRTGDVTVEAGNSISIANHGGISIENSATVSDSAKINPSTVRVSAPGIYLNNSEITTRSTGNVAAGNIDVSFINSLCMDSSFITTEANVGNGGSINIHGGQLIRLQNSGFKTTVHGTSGNGGNIDVFSDIFLMETGLIQANTAASGASGGNITLNLKSLIPSGNMLTIGGTDPIDWQPGIFGLNVIQAAAPSGLSGKIRSSAPRLNLSGELAYLGSPQFDNSAISPDYCALGSGSSLTLTGKGGLMPKGSDWSAY